MEILKNFTTWKMQITLYNLKSMAYFPQLFFLHYFFSEFSSSCTKHDNSVKAITLDMEILKATREKI